MTTKNDREVNDSKPPYVAETDNDLYDSMVDVAMMLGLTEDEAYMEIDDYFNF